jgi:CRISPR/Cas system CSM-associated protein Csm4 (group 5 of RAMP superfamily)
VEASARAMVSITWKKVTGSVSIPSDERGSNKRNSRASWSLSSRSGVSRRASSIAFEAAATSALTASARAITV